MAKRSHSGAVATDAEHRVTAFEVFFDLVFVFAFTQIIAFMVQDLTAVALVQGLLLLLLMWWAWTAFSWLGNQVRADRGPALAADLAAMAAIFIVGLLLPEAFADRPGGIRAPLILAIAYSLVRALYLVTYQYAAGDDRELRSQLTRSATPSVVAIVPLIIGALVGGVIQIVLWAAAFAIDFGGGRLISSYGGYRIHSPGYFAERHRLVVIIALGESIAAVGAGIGAIPIDAAILTGATLGFALTVALWLLYFRGIAPAIQRGLSELQGRQRAWLARDAGTFLHFLLIAGIFYIALGVEQVLAVVAGHGHHQAGDTSAPLGWLPLIALLGGAALYLAGLIAVSRRTTESRSRVGWLAVGVLLVLLPFLHLIPALAALGVATGVLLALAVVVATVKRP